MPTLVSQPMRFCTLMVALLAVASGRVAALQLISVSDEIQLGRDTQVEVRRSVPEVSDPVVRAYVTEVGARLVQHAGGAAYPYSFSTADAREVNAFALPGGPIWIHRGILEIADDEAQVAGVLAHEIAHVAGRHTAKQVSRSVWASGALAVLATLGDDGGWRGAALALGSSIAAGAALLTYSRRDERAADREGVRILRAAGYDPRGLLEFMQRLDGDLQSTPGAMAQFFATHPAPRDRVRHLEREVAGGTGDRLGARLGEMQRRLSRLPATPRRLQP